MKKKWIETFQSCNAIWRMAAFDTKLHRCHTSELQLPGLKGDPNGLSAKQGRCHDAALSPGGGTNTSNCAEGQPAWIQTLASHLLSSLGLFQNTPILHPWGRWWIIFPATLKVGVALWLTLTLWWAKVMPFLGQSQQTLLTPEWSMVQQYRNHWEAC